MLTSADIYSENHFVSTIRALMCTALVRCVPSLHAGPLFSVTEALMKGHDIIRGLAGVHANHLLVRDL
jgi:hypothetical protein